eukprot:5213982-Amphidinium_carterae.3
MLSKVATRGGDGDVDVDRARLCRPVGGMIVWDTVNNEKERHAAAKVGTTIHAVSSQRHGGTAHPPTSDRPQPWK